MLDRCLLQDTLQSVPVKPELEIKSVTPSAIDQSVNPVLRLKLAEGLKARRLGRGLTQVQLAKAVRSSQSRVAKMESGDPTVSLDLLVRSLLALGTTNRELAQIITQRSRAA
jgi:DNA-binding XRE family transcriptional regulator